MTPLEIEILLHYYCTPGDFEPERLDAPGVKAAIDRFIWAGLLVDQRDSVPPGESLYTANREALNVYIEALKAVPLPTRQWVVLKKEEKTNS